jgi:hypothetical protein
MVCVDINSIQHQKALLLYGKTFVNYLYNLEGNINKLTKGLPSLPDIVINDDLINLIKSNDSTIEQYMLYVYNDTDKDFGTWLENNINENILTKPVISSIYLTKEKETLLLDNFDIKDIEGIEESKLLDFADEYSGEQYEEDKLQKLNSVLNNKLASTIILKGFYNNPLTVNRKIDNYIADKQLEELANKNIIEKLC